MLDSLVAMAQGPKALVRVSNKLLVVSLPESVHARSALVDLHLLIRFWAAQVPQAPSFGRRRRAMDGRRLRALIVLQQRGRFQLAQPFRTTLHVKKTGR